MLYQAQDTCFFCIDNFVTLMSPDYTESGSVDPVAFSFVADTYKEETTTTTSSSTSTSTSTVLHLLVLQLQALQHVTVV